jgi:uncharacterized protein with GYD domain
MALSMIQFSYTPQVVKKLIANPEDRSAAVKKLIEKLGGKLISFYYSFGDYDGIVISEMPDNISSLTTAIAAYSEGNLSSLKTTVLISVEDAMKAMKKASTVKLEQPKG